MPHNYNIYTIQKIALHKTIDMTDKEKDLVNRLGNYIQQKGMSNECLVQIIEQAGFFLNPQTISDYANNHGLSYNGVKNYREIIKLFGVKFVIDNK